MTRTLLIDAMVLTLMSICSLAAVADGSPGNEALAIIDGSVGSNAQGLIGVNMAAGDANLQSNATAISAAAGAAVAQSHALQVIDTGQFSVPVVAVTRIEDGAFNNAAGAIAINQAAGAANTQANGVAIAFGVGAEVTADAELAQSISGVAPMVASANGLQREATVADSAFTGSRGIVQVNQSAGMANATSNSFTLRVQLGVTP